MLIDRNRLQATCMVSSEIDFSPESCTIVTFSLERNCEKVIDVEDKETRCNEEQNKVRRLNDEDYMMTVMK